MKIKEKLFWERFRPNTINPEKGKIPIILLPRVKKIIDNGIPFNLLLEGEGGVGKSSLIRILAKDTNCLTINCSDDRGIDIVREQMFDHCKNYSLIGNRGMKVIFMEEFDNATPDMRKALRGFIEEHSESVRFIACVNNINKLKRTEEDKALLSRFNIINFTPINKEETEYLKTQQFNYLKAICKIVSFDCEEDIIRKIINKTFPNFRTSVQTLQELTITDDITNFASANSGDITDLYSFIMNKNINLQEIYYYVIENYPKDKTEDLLNLLSRKFFKYLIDEQPDLIPKLGKKLLDLSKEYNSEYSNSTDPEIHLINYIVKLKELF